MAADLHIHAMIDVTEDDLACFFATTLGSRWMNLGRPRCPDQPLCPHWKAVATSPSVWVGEVSWLKAALHDDDGFVPEPVAAVQALIGDNLPTLDDELRAGLLRAMATPNQRAKGYDTTRDEGVVGWLDQHMGQRLFTVSW